MPDAGKKLRSPYSIQNGFEWLSNSTSTTFSSTDTSSEIAFHQHYVGGQSAGSHHGSVDGTKPCHQWDADVHGQPSHWHTGHTHIAFQFLYALFTAFRGHQWRTGQEWTGSGQECGMWEAVMTGMGMLRARVGRDRMLP